MTPNTGGSNGQAIVGCNNLTVAFDREVVLDNVSLAVPKGAFLPIVGPNGAGKTTLLRALLGLVRPRSGTIFTPFGVSPPGYVPQQRVIDHLFPVTVRQIVQMGLYPRLSFWRRSVPEQERRIDAALDQVGLARHDQKRYSELSGGMKQKVFIARALVSGAEVFVMDEPTSELDERSERDVIGNLARLSREQGKTVLLAVHGLDHVMAFAATTCVVEHGRVRLSNILDTPKRGGG
ncbi:MAG: ABC transporter ATP-binding protein [Planctomycetota bacterium]